MAESRSWNPRMNGSVASMTVPVGAGTPWLAYLIQLVIPKTRANAIKGIPHAMYRLATVKSYTK